MQKWDISLLLGLIFWSFPPMMIQANNAYIFPGIGLGLVISGAIRVHDSMLLAACKFTIYFSLYVLIFQEKQPPFWEGAKTLTGID